MQLLTLSEIWVYPIKSMGGVPLASAEVLGKGLLFDRRWMLIDPSGACMTQRGYPAMARFQVAIKGGGLIVTFLTEENNIASIDIPATAHHKAATRVEADVWGDKVEAVEGDPAISGWFTKHLGTKCRLVAFPENNARPVDPDYSIGEDHVSLADAFPFLLISRRSLEDLNARLSTPVPMDRFRPNFIVDGGEPFQEDGWKELTIADVAFAAVKRSARCTLITVDQATGTKTDEPLRTLSAYRREGNKVYFGQNLIALQQGTVRVGDAVIPL